MLVLVTGGAGFIGANLVRALSSEGHRLRVLDDLSSGLMSNLDGLSLDFQQGSVTDPDVVESCMSGADAVVHLAARGSVPRSVADPESTHRVNATGTLNVLQAARIEGAHVVFSSSSSVYGANLDLPKREEMWAQPTSPYGASKLAAESYVLAFREVYEMNTLALRFFNVYGPLQRPDHNYAAVIPKFAWAALRGTPLEIDGDGQQTRDFTHVDSVVSVIVDALDRRLSLDRPLNLAFGNRITVNGIAQLIGGMIEQPIEILHRPPRLGDVRDSQNDPTLLRQVFPSIEPLSLDPGLATVIDWLRRDPELHRRV